MLGEGSGRRPGTEDEGELGYAPFVVMEDLLDKLKVLNYDVEVIKSLKMRPLSRHYFAIQSNTGEQFFMFTTLAAWLIRKCGLTIDQPQEYDDPNSTVASILEAMRTLGLPVDFSLGKLKKGSGWYILQCLDCLANKALEATSFIYKRAVAPQEAEASSEVIDDNVELLLDRIEEEMAEEESDLDEDNVLNIDELHIPRSVDHGKRGDIVESSTTLDEWNLELERVLPLLKVSIKSNAGDWRSHLESMKHHQNGLSDILSSVLSQLNRLGTEINGVMSKISKREKLINNQLDSMLSQYRTLQDELAVVSEQYREVNGGIVERQKTLNHITESLDSVKQEMEERGASMSDGSPLVQIKKVIKDIKKELAEMDINIAIAEHVIIETRLRDKSLESHLIRTSGVV